MPNRMVSVRVERTFNRYNARDELLLEETDEVKAYVAARLLTILRVESPVEPKRPKAKAAKKSAKAKASA